MSDDKKGKPTYQAPVVMPLGELAKSEGQIACHDGGSASNCNEGANARRNCNAGVRALTRCGDGQTARCRTGNWAL
jgi:hypothetical protein